jgi:hypothetical protein
MSDRLKGFTDEQKLSIFEWMAEYEFSKKNMAGIQEALGDMLAISHTEQELKNGPRFIVVESKVANIIAVLKYVIVSLLGVAGKVIFDILFSGRLPV